MANNANQEIKELRDEVQQLTSKLERSLKNSASNASADIIGLDRKQIKTMARKAGRELRHYIDEKSKQAEDLRDAYEERVSAHPYQSVLAALAGGLLLGALLRK